MNSVVSYHQILSSPHLLACQLKKDRFYFVKSQGWYYYSREGINGPFADKQIAENNLRDYIIKQTCD